MDADPVELRVLGALLEKQLATPDQYPLTLNALRAACNQSTNRDPVTDYDEATIRTALQRLARRGWTRFAGGPGSRAPKYRHLVDEALRVRRDEQAILAVLLLRGPQTPGELRQRTERMHAFADGAALEDALARLAQKRLVTRLERRPGQKEARYAHLLGSDAAEDARPPAPVAPPGEWVESDAAAPAGSSDGPAELIAELTRRVEALEAEVARLRGELGE